MNQIFKSHLVFILFTLFGSFGAFATTDFQCVTSVPTTSVIAKNLKNQVSFNIIHHNGTQFAPIHHGLITISDLPMIERRGRLIEMMGESISLKFDTKKCKIHQDLNYSCFSDKEQKIGNLQVKNFGFQTYSSESFLYDTIFKEFHFSFYVRTMDGENLRMNMVYDLNSRDCSFRN
jgi:hypothetical protein